MKFFSVLAFAMTAFLMAVSCDKPSIQPTKTPMPDWLRQKISDGGEYPPVVLYVSYYGEPAYQTTATDRFDTGDEHGLFATDGKLICRFGVWSLRVALGSCEVREIIYMGLLYEPEINKRGDQGMPSIGSRLWD